MSALADTAPRFVPTGCPALDTALGGGWAEGRIVELAGSAQDVAGLEASTVALARRARALDAAEMPDDTAVVRHQAVFALAIELLESRTRPDLLVLRVDDEGLSGGEHGLGARVASRAMRQLCSLSTGTVRRDPCTVLVVRRAAERRDVVGNALKFYASMRVEVRDATARIVKNKFAPPFQTVSLLEVA